MKAKTIAIYVLISTVVLMLFTINGHAIEAVASIKNVKGDVDIQRKRSTIAARMGLILYDKDLVVTNPRSKVTIVFRDGSEIRLFANTKFLIEKSEEAQSGSRRFLNNFRLKLGSFWGKFTKKRQETVIKTPTATAGIKGTTVSFAERNGVFDISLSSGIVEVKNERETVELTTGKMIKSLTKDSTISDKIEVLPYKLVIKSDVSEITLPNKGQEKEIYFTLQLINVKTNKNVSKKGDVYISIDSDNIELEPNIVLNSRGYARFRATVKPFDKVDYKNGILEFYALMDGEQYLDIGASKAVISYEMPADSKRKLKIDASSGKVQ